MAPSCNGSFCRERLTTLCSNTNTTFVLQDSFIHSTLHINYIMWESNQQLSLIGQLCWSIIPESLDSSKDPIMDRREGKPGEKDTLHSRKITRFFLLTLLYITPLFLNCDLHSFNTSLITQAANLKSPAIRATEILSLSNERCNHQEEVYCV